MNYQFADRVRYFDASAVREILKVVNKGNVISLAGGLPDEALFPVEAVDQAFSKAINSGNKALQYAETEGLFKLRQQLAERMHSKGMHAQPDNMLITSGSQQAIDLFSRIMFNPGDVVLTEDPTYLAAIQVFQSYEVDIVPVKSDRQGMVEEDLEEKLEQHQPKCVYVVPTFSNPDGKVWSKERREMLIALAKKYQVVIFEDDPYGEIQFEPDQVPNSIQSLDHDGEYVVYTSTISKTVVPAMRLGWITGPKEVIQLVTQAKQAADLHTNSISQHALSHLLNDYDLDQHIKRITTVYYERMNVMKDCLNDLDLEGLVYEIPKGGMFFWLTLPDSIDPAALLEKAVDNGVAFVPGKPFYVEANQTSTMRLNFTNATIDEIKEGMNRLVKTFNEI
ncbi:2-aminoadipate transaminase [Pelagirhabdus alkalitolerans]|uniref:2-aminoadipate transaminase n=1 Tax=Pelagirhabdus alkalitolerans TaxID=1612202 RepID=A0A1G6JPI3_9BACI|nr:PLP-dependent aminotransferase family protein [Pelagirhabdus alkalitolerans]SDC19866.1 2-aminoadipate transaminase [Pelagirhabdus alkalitolerans]